MPNSPRFKEKVSLEERKKESQVKKEQYPNLIPIIIERNNRSTLKDLEKKKFNCLKSGSWSLLISN